MSWLTWRQFRTQAIVAGGALLAFAIVLVVLGVRIRGAAGTPGFTDRYRMPLFFLDALLIAVPGLIGLFWGAPLVTREFEAGTHRLVWNQSVSRRRWLAVKLLVLGLAGMAAAGLASLLLTWAASPYDAAAGDRFSALLFGTRNIAPVGYAAFAFVLGTVVGLSVRRTVPAMALTIVAFLVVQIAMPLLVRPHLGTPVTATRPVTADTIRNLSFPTAFLGADGQIRGLQIPGAWVVSNGRLLQADGRPVDLDRYHDCVLQAPEQTASCLGGLNLHVAVAYHPGSRYWAFQGAESGLYLALAGLLAGFGLWRIRGSTA
jgi:ABC-type transport system involved in multi-copper enzyme maturation permease subunit